MSIFEMMIKVDELMEQERYLKSMKEHMDVTYEFDCCEQEFAYDCVTEELNDVEKALDYYVSLLSEITEL